LGAIKPAGEDDGYVLGIFRIIWIHRPAYGPSGITTLQCNLKMSSFTGVIEMPGIGWACNSFRSLMRRERVARVTVGNFVDVLEAAMLFRCGTFFLNFWMCHIVIFSNFLDKLIFAVVLEYFDRFVYFSVW
jgi:hypothetical protein